MRLLALFPALLCIILPNLANAGDTITVNYPANEGTYTTVRLKHEVKTVPPDGLSNPSRPACVNGNNNINDGVIFAEGIGNEKGRLKLCVNGSAVVITGACFNLFYTPNSPVPTCPAGTYTVKTFPTNQALTDRFNITATDTILTIPCCK